MSLLFYKFKPFDTFSIGYQRVRAKCHFLLVAQVLAARKQRNLTQLELAQLSGVQQADISRIENGQSFPTTETLAKLLQALQAKVKIELVS